MQTSNKGITFHESMVRKKSLLETTLLADPSFETAIRTFYGDSLINRVLARFSWSTFEQIPNEAVGLLLQGIGAQVLRSEIRSLATRLLHLDSLQPESRVFNLLLTRPEQEELFHLLNDSPCDAEGNIVLSHTHPSITLRVLKLFYQGRGEEDPLIDFGYSKNELRKLRVHLSKAQYKTGDQDRRLREILAFAPSFQVVAGDRCVHFPKEEQQRRATGEFFSRIVAYRQLKKEMLVPCPLGNERYCIYQVVGGVDSHGFAVWILQNIHPDKAGDIRLLCRGTNPRDVLSIRGCLGESVGAAPLQENAEALVQELSQLCDQAAEPVHLFIHGHSQGGAIGQLLCVQLAQVLAANSCPTGLYYIHSMDLCVWNAPGVSATVTNAFIHGAIELSHPSRRHFCRFNVEYNQVRSDPVHKFGVQYVGTGALSRNVKRAVYRYRTSSHRPLLGPHCSPIHIGHKSKPIEAFVDDPIRFLRILKQYHEACISIDSEEEFANEHLETLVKQLTRGIMVSDGPNSNLNSAQVKLMAVIYQLLEVDARLQGTLFNNLLDPEKRLAGHLLDSSKRNLEEVIDTRRGLHERVRPALRLTGQSMLFASLAGFSAAALTAIPLWASVSVLAAVSGVAITRAAYHWVRKFQGTVDPIDLVAAAIRSRTDSCPP